MIFKFVIRSFKRDWVRLLIAVLGVGAATGLIVWAMGLTVTAMRQSHMYATRMTKPYTCWVNTGEQLFTRWRRGSSPLTQPRAVVPPELDRGLIDAVKQTSAVRGTYECRATRVTIDYRPGGRVMQGPPMSTVVTLATEAGSPYKHAKITGEWPDRNSSEPLAAVCTSIFRPRRLEKPPLGTPLVLLTTNGTLTVKISAYIDAEELGAGFPTLFTTDAAVRELFGDEAVAAGPNILFCETKDSDSAINDVKRIVKEYEAEHGPLAGGAVNTRGELAGELVSDALMNFKHQAPLLLTLSVLAAFCMLFNALTIGVEQRMRIMGLLRTIGMTSAQVAGVVALEGALVAFGGWLIGLLGGALVLRAFVARAAETFPEGMALGWITPSVTAGGVALIALITLVWVCKKALKIHPLDYIASDKNEERPIRAVRSILGIALLFPMLILALPFSMPSLARNLLLLFVGLPIHGLGLYLALPLFIRVLELIVVPPVSVLLRLDPKLLRRRSSRHYPRTAGMILMLAVGLGSFSAIHIWGGSMMAPYIPSKEFPDVIVSLLPNGVDADAAATVSKQEGIANNTCLSIEAVQLDITPDLVEVAEKIVGKPQMFPNALLMGVDSIKMFAGDKPLAHFKFEEGDRESAAKMLAEGNACVVARMFARATNLKVGDDLTLVTKLKGRFSEEGMRRGGGMRGGGMRGGERPKRMDAENLPTVTFRVVGIVDLNWHLLTSRANLRGRDGVSYGTLGPVFIDEGAARRLSGNQDKTYYLWANLSEPYKALGALPAGQKLEGDIRRDLKVGSANTIRVHHRDEISDGTIAHGNHLIGDMARAPFWSLIVLATGIVTLLIASVRASAHELSIMRMVGMTRSQLGRLLLGEALTAAFGGIILSLISGVCIGWTFTGWTRAAMSYGGLPLTLSIPWLIILRGSVFALLLCFVMALPPIVWLVYSGQRFDKDI